MTKTALLCAGGTGGHMFPAQALAEELKVRGWAVDLATDERGLRYSADFPVRAVHTIPSATFGSKNPIALVRSATLLFKGYFAARRILSSLGPSVAVGFGGYPTLPSMFAASHKSVPLVLHEQNAVLGRANKLLSSRAHAVAAGFAGEGLPDHAVITGNPLRPTVLEIARRLDGLTGGGQAYTASVGDAPFHLLVFGGSQGASYFGETVPAAIALLPQSVRKRLRLTLQARPDTVETVRAALDGLVDSVEIAHFFDDMPARIEKAHLVISRAGASTVSEIAAIGRPALLVPYPHALDHDQAANAQQLVERGGAHVVKQSDLDAAALSDHIHRAMLEPDRLAQQAQAAAMTAQPDATDQLADLVEMVAHGRYKPTR
ncbi:MAG: undecaprenyldiphospho-muramoylpentapeptide beta-N-acetylglucosaminyltransferase [Pseudomonadota bacterium]